LDSCTGGFVVVGGGIREDDDDDAGDDAGGPLPNLRGTGDGGGGGGIRVEDEVSRDGGAADGAEEMRWALSMAGKAAGESSGERMDKDGFVGVVGDSPSPVTAGLLCCVERVGNHERR
jgi:hypothetical protein